MAVSRVTAGRTTTCATTILALGVNCLERERVNTSASPQGNAVQAQVVGRIRFLDQSSATKRLPDSDRAAVS